MLEGVIVVAAHRDRPGELGFRALEVAGVQRHIAHQVGEETLLEPGHRGVAVERLAGQRHLLQRFGLVAAPGRQPGPGVSGAVIPEAPGMGARLRLPVAQLGSPEVHPLGGGQVAGVDADPGRLVGHFPLLIEGVPGLLLLPGDPVGDHHFLILDHVVAVALEPPGHRHPALHLGFGGGAHRVVDQPLPDDPGLGALALAVQRLGLALRGVHHPGAFGTGTILPAQRRGEHECGGQELERFHGCSLDRWIHFFSLTPASWATAASVVCAALSPSRKSLSE